jgi:hypothetical protein
MKRMKARLRWGFIWLIVFNSVSTAKAQQTPLEETINTVANDLALFLGNAPVYLSSRLPVIPAGSNYLASMELTEYKDISLAFGIECALFPEFKNIGYGMKLLKYGKRLPSYAPFPLVTVGLRVGVTKHLDLGARADFFPEIDTEYKGILVGGVSFNIGGDIRYRLWQGKGALPDLIFIGAVNYFSGYLKVGKNFKFDFDEIIEEMRIKGSIEFQGAPLIGWDIFQISPELRLKWKIGSIHPFLGLGLDFSFGHIDGGLDLKIGFNLTHPEQISESESETLTLTTEKPRTFGLRPLIGIESHLTKNLKTMLQANIEFFLHQKPNPNLEPEIKRLMGQDPNYEYNRAKEESGFDSPVYMIGLNIRYEFK